MWAGLRILGVLAVVAALAAAEGLASFETVAATRLGPLDFEDGEPHFETADRQGGAGATVESWPPGSGNRALLVRETTDGIKPNRGSTLRLRLDPGHPLVARIDQVLAAPSDDPPVAFRIDVRVARAAPSSRLLHARLGIEFHGRERPVRFPQVGNTDLAQTAWYATAGGLIDVHAAGGLDGLRFSVVPTGGAARIDRLDLRLDLRVEGGDTSPEVLVLDDLAVIELAGTAPVGDGPVLAVVGATPAAALREVARELGMVVAPPSKGVSPAADCYLVAEPITGESEARALAAALERGAGLVLTVPEGHDIHPAFEARLPVNGWSFEAHARGALRRYGAPLVVEPGGRLTAAGFAGELAVASRFDLHLPYSPMEHGLQRYLPERYHKALEVTDWRIELRCGVDGWLPAAVSGRSGPARVLVLAAALDDPELRASPGYRDFLRAALQAVAPRTEDPGVGADALRIAIARHQPEALAVEVRNPAREPARALLAVEVATWTRELRHVGTHQLAIPAGGSVRIPVGMRDATIGALVTPGDALPLRRVRAAILSADRRTSHHALDTVVDVAPAVTIAIDEDPVSYADMEGWATLTRHSGGALMDGRIAQRYVHRAGTSPRISVRIANGRHQLAPLATARDLGDPGNPTTGGLNDLSWSIADLRGKLPLQGGWSGRPAAEQHLALEWDAPVLLAAQRLTGSGGYRKWDRSNPPAWRLSADGRELAAVVDAAFAVRGGNIYAYHEREFGPTTTRGLELQISGLDPEADHEPRNRSPANCTLWEWEVLGWPGTEPPPPVRDELVVTAIDPASGTRQEIHRETIELAALTERAVELELPGSTGFGARRYEIRFGETGADHEVLFVPDGGRVLESKEERYAWTKGLLCTPGWVQVDGFGRGMKSHTGGWGGEDDQIWAGIHNLTEIGAGAREGLARMLTSAHDFDHYTNPWRRTPDGVYSWDELAADMLRNLTVGSWRSRLEGGRRFHVIGSDRWNGIDIGRTWGWAEFIAFDRHLRAQGGAGLQGRTRGEIAAEIWGEHGDAWQRWQLETYADAHLATQAAFAAAGIEYSFETHGNFPLCGGELGAKLARTHEGVGTDLFWMLARQDLVWSLGERFAVVAVNPDLRSGAYGQWGWVSTEHNPWWFANNGGVETARRQWAATYYLGRVTHRGGFEPYHVMGFGYQGGYGTKMTIEDYRRYHRAIHTMSRLRPERATGIGMVVSWAQQEARMGPEIGHQGFGLYPAAGQDAVDETFAHTWHRLVQQGLPVGFVTSTHALQRWDGRQPLVVSDGYRLANWEIDELERLARNGTPIVAVGAVAAGFDRAAAFFGVAPGADGPRVADGVERTDLGHGLTAYLRRMGPTPVVLVACAPDALPPAALPALVDRVNAWCLNGLRLSRGLSLTPWIAHDRLFLNLCDHGTTAREVELEFDPEALLPELRGRELRVVDLETNRAVDAVPAGDRWRLRLPLGASDGHILAVEAEGGP